ncbi:MAG: carboxypeptidase-like regulatory domain-containing protein [Elusimicrobiales bacterium]|nr:carboxypeptidase-like regulatory domain-containing protein [Elusimicrobiales bacterium]
MRLFNKTILSALLTALAVSAAGAATTINVYVKTGVDTPVQDVSVAAVEFGMNGPSTHTQVGLTGADGKISFVVENNRNFNLYYSLHGYSPSISDQFNNPEYDPNRYVWTDGTTRYSTFTVTPGLTNVARIRLEIANATANTVLFGGVYNMLAQQQAGTGIVETLGDGTGMLVVDNVPYAEANTYNIGLYDPYLNRGTGRNVMTALNDSLPLVVGVRTLSYTGAAKADFANSMPPSRVESNTADSRATSVSTSTIDGIVRSTGTTLWSAIPRIGVNFRSCSDYKWANVDENGRFQLTGLMLGATYYAESMGGCAWRQDGNGACYEPYSSPALTGGQDLCSGLAARGENDFVYVSSALPIFQGVASPAYYDSLRIQLNEMNASTGSFKVCVKAQNGMALPNSNIHINSDGSPWSKNATGCAGTNQADYQWQPGYAMKNTNTGPDGCATLTGLPTGNYVVNVWTQFSGNGSQTSYNSGTNGSPAWGMEQSCMDQTCWLQAHCAGTGVDDYRVFVETNTSLGDNQMLHIYNSSSALVLDGNGVKLSSITYVVQTGGNNSGLVRGTLKFPGVTDLSNNPVMITLYPDCSDGACPSGNFTTVSGSGQAEYTYAINVASGTEYYMYTKATNWGRVRRGGGNSRVSLASTGTVVIDMDFSPGGSVTGTVYKPDGTVLIPANNQYIWVDIDNETGWTGTQVQKDGTFAVTDALAGVNRIRVNASGDSSTAFNYAMPSPAPIVTVFAGSTSTVNVNLVAGTYVGIGFNPALTPDPSVRISTGNQDTVIGFKVIPLPAGTILKGETIMNMLAGKDDQLKFRYSTGTVPGDENGACGPGQPPGFCALAIPSPSVYDFYLMRAGDFGDMSAGPQPDMPYPHFSLLTSSKNVIVDTSRANALVKPAYSMGFSSGVLVNLNPAVTMASRGNATITGHVTATNFFRQSDYDALGGDFEAFLRFLPVVTLYDSAGAFKAAGLVVPPMEFIAQKELTGAFMGTFAQGYAQFRDMLAEAPYYAYEIRGVAPSACYTAVVTTPNYPPYQTRTCLGVNGSTTTLSINLDDAVGAGATLTGVVTTTNTAVRLSNVAVSLVGEAIDPRSVVTDSTGVYKFEGLPPGNVRLKISAEGYALADAEKDLVGSNVYTQNIQLTAAGGSVSGTVYSQKLPFAKVQPGALIYAYNDTYNGNNPAAPLPLIKTRTGADGTYRLTGLIPNNVYKLFLKVPGKYTLNQAFTAVDGLTSGKDFTMLPKPLDIEVFAKKGAEYYEFTVLNPSDFKTGNVIYGPSPLDPANVSTVTMTNLSSGELSGKIPLSALASGVTYVLQGAAQSYSGRTVVRELLFGKSYKGNAEQQIDDLIIGDDTEDEKGRRGNEAAMDNSGDDPSAIMFPPGAVLPVSTGAVPTCTFKGEDKNDASVADKVAALGADAFAGNLYTVALSSVTSNEDKSIELTLAYDKTTADLTDLSVARYSTATSKWEDVPGVATVNPLKGTVKVKLKNLASVLAKPGTVQVNSFDGRQYVVRPQAAGSASSGTFAVIRPSVAGNTFSGTKLKVFNYPNPFNLKSKPIANSHGAALDATTNGTVIHVEVPAANGGPCHIRIYTLAGELVKDLASNCEGGKYNYFGWDGHNAGGQEVANGVYYGVVELSGKKPSRENATFKMAVIK